MQMGEWEAKVKAFKKVQLAQLVQSEFEFLQFFLLFDSKFRP